MPDRGYMPQAKTVEHETPRATFHALDEEFGPFTCDPSCTQDQYTARTIMQRGGHVIHQAPRDMDDEMLGWEFTSAINGLTSRWRGRVFLNPPYGREMPKWIERAVAEVEAGNCELVCALIPARTDTKMWQKFILREMLCHNTGERWILGHPLLRLVRFLPGRLKFGDSKDPAPFPSAVVVWSR